MLAALSSPPGRWVSGGALLLCVLVSSCDESLPTRIVPQNDLEIARVLIAQQTGPAGIQVLSAFYVENMYDETFSGMVNAKGNVRIWWKRRPGFEANLPVRENTQLRLDPGSATPSRCGGFYEPTTADTSSTIWIFRATMCAMGSGTPGPRTSCWRSA